jgi:hypothetical protein
MAWSTTSGDRYVNIAVFRFQSTQNPEVTSFVSIFNYCNTKLITTNYEPPHFTPPRRKLFTYAFTKRRGRAVRTSVSYSEGRGFESWHGDRL